MINLDSIVAFFRKANWTELTTTHGISRALEENTVNYLTVGKCVGMFALSTNETNTPVVPESEGDFSLDDSLALVLSEEPFFQSAKLLRSQ
jgi:hypothetical protein